MRNLIFLHNQSIRISIFFREKIEKIEREREFQKERSISSPVESFSSTEKVKKETPRSELEWSGVEWSGEVKGRPPPNSICPK